MKESTNILARKAHRVTQPGYSTLTRLRFPAVIAEDGEKLSLVRKMADSDLDFDALL